MEDRFKGGGIKTEGSSRDAGARKGENQPALTHVDPEGRARMVDVSAKEDTVREAVARGEVRMKRSTLDLIRGQGVEKGDVLGVARVAGIMAAKETGRTIPLCHPIPLTGVQVQFRFDEQGSGVEIEARVKTVGKTGAEMEALTAVAVAGLTIYDMCKAVDRSMTLERVRLVKKTGGKTGSYYRPGEEEWESLE